MYQLFNSKNNLILERHANRMLKMISDLAKETGFLFEYKNMEQVKKRIDKVYEGFYDTLVCF